MRKAVAKKNGHNRIECLPQGMDFVNLNRFMGAECPRADSIEIEGDVISVRGYFDFGIKTLKLAVA